MPAASVGLSTTRSYLVLSEKSLISAFISRTTSFVNNIKRRGPRIKPWGSPALIGNQSEQDFLVSPIQIVLKPS